MIFRATALSLVILVGISAVVSLTTNYTEAGAIKHRKYKKKLKKYKKYSKQWWRLYRAQAKERKALEISKRMQRLDRIRLANKRLLPTQTKRQNFVGLAPANQIEELFLLIEGKVKSVYEGDAIGVETKDGKVYQIRMLGIDAPEIREDFGERSQKKLSDLILGKNVTVIIRKKNSSDLYSGTVYYGGQDINLKQIETGMAWYFQQNGYEALENDRRIYKQAEQKSRIKRSGLWKREETNAVLGFRK